MFRSSKKNIDYAEIVDTSPLEELKNQLTILELQAKGDFTGLQSVWYFLDWPIGETREIKGNTITKISQDKVKMCWKCSTKPGCGYPFHYHIYLDELVIMLTGVFTVFVGAKKAVKRLIAGKSIFLKSSQKHEFKNETTEVVHYDVEHYFTPDWFKKYGKKSKWQKFKNWFK